MPSTYRPRGRPCSGCGDVVNIVEVRRAKLFGFRPRGEPTVRLEHADPAPDGAVFDPVDDACRRAPVTRRDEDLPLR